MICADADIDMAVNLAGIALFTNNGELCVIVALYLQIIAYVPY